MLTITRSRIPRQLLARNSKLLFTQRNASTSSNYCKDYVRKHDYEGYLLAPFYPPQLQDAYWAIRAFYVELAMVQNTVSTPLIGGMRMQFWRDLVKNVFEGNPPQQPVAIALHEALNSPEHPMKVQRYHFKRIIDARQSEMENSSFLTTDALTSHAESTSSVLHYILLDLLLPSASSASSSAQVSTLSHALSHLGTASTVANLLRALPFHAAKGRMVLPADITAKHGVIQENVFRYAQGNVREETTNPEKASKDRKALEEAVYELACLANDHVQTAKTTVYEEFNGKIPERVLPVFLSGAITQTTLTRLEQSNFNTFDTRTLAPGAGSRADWRLAWNVWRSWYTSKI